jgi:hypothetical protein
MPADPSDAAAIAQGLAASEEMTLSFGDPGTDPEPSRGASAPASATASTPPAATGAEEGQDGAAPEAEGFENGEPIDGQPGDEAAVEYSDEDLVALEELRAYFEEEARKAIVPQLQSSYDRQIAQLNRQIQEAQRQAAERERELLQQVREAQLNGLPEAEREKLRQQWDWEDRVRALDERERELTAYHTDLLREAYAQEYAAFGLTAEDLEEFSTPEEMDEFVKEVQLEYYRQLAELRAQGLALPADEEEAPRRAAAKPAATPKRAPAGAQAPSDGGGGGAVPAVTKFNSGTGLDAMAENIRNGWESVTVR